MTKVADGQAFAVNGVDVKVETEANMAALTVGPYRVIPLPADEVRSLANLAVKCLRAGETPELAAARSLAASSIDPWDAHMIANHLMGRCPDGCCGWGADMPMDEAPAEVRMFAAAWRCVGPAL